MAPSIILLVVMYRILNRLPYGIYFICSLSALYKKIGYLRHTKGVKWLPVSLVWKMVKPSAFLIPFLFYMPQLSGFYHR